MGWAYDWALTETAGHMVVRKHDANSTLKNHIEHKYCKALKNQTSRGLTSMTNEGNVFAYSVDAVREQIAHFVIQESRDAHESVWDFGLV
ncbi:hypothetical protein R6Q59_003355 [Mikania micrantha]